MCIRDRYKDINVNSVSIQSKRRNCKLLKIIILFCLTLKIRRVIIYHNVWKVNVILLK